VGMIKHRFDPEVSRMDLIQGLYISE